VGVVVFGGDESRPLAVAFVGVLLADLVFVVVVETEVAGFFFVEAVLVATDEGGLVWFADFMVFALEEAAMDEVLGGTPSFDGVARGLLVYLVFAILFYERFLEGRC